MQLNGRLSFSGSAVEFAGRVPQPPKPRMLGAVPNMQRKPARSGRRRGEQAPRLIGVGVRRHRRGRREIPSNQRVRTLGRLPQPVGAENRPTATNATREDAAPAAAAARGSLPRRRARPLFYRTRQLQPRLRSEPRCDPGRRPSGLYQDRLAAELGRRLSRLPARHVLCAAVTAAGCGAATRRARCRVMRRPARARAARVGFSFAMPA